MSRINKTRNFSATQTIQCFNSTQMFKTKENERLVIDDLEHIYNYLYEDNFQNILIKGKISFLNLIENKIQEIISYHFDEEYINSPFFRRTINKFKKEIENKYLKDYSFLNEQYKKNINEFKDNERTYVFKFFQHCANIKDCAYHPCSTNKKGKFILVSNPLNNSQETKYVICFECKQCYKSSCFYTICLSCNKEYYSSISDDNIDNNIVLATWEKYHCGGTLTDQIMKCIKCKKELYLNLITNKLICLNKNCNFEAKPHSILWKCTFCSKDFRSKAKAYNPLELQIIKKAINYALLMKLKASPFILPCCKKEINDLVFYHKEECKGILFKGYLKGKEILVCKKCHAMNFIDKFSWVCPLCGKKFHSHHSKSVNPYKKNNNNNYIIEKQGEINNKIPTRLFLKKEYSNSSLKENKSDSEQNDNDIDNLNLRNNNLKTNNKYFLTEKYLNSIENNSNSNDENKEQERNEFKKSKKKNNSRNNLILENINTDNEDNDKRRRKKNRITLFEVLEKRKKNYLDKNSIKNIALKETIDSFLINKNVNKTKNIEKEKYNINKKNIFLLGQESSSDNKNCEINCCDTEDEQNNKKRIIELNNKKLISKENFINRNTFFPNYMNSYDNLSKKKNLIKCKSTNLFKDSNNINNVSESSNRNNENHQTNYLYTTNSNYNIKVSLNINHNICPYSKKEEKNNDNNNNKSMFQNEGLDQIKEIYLQEILKNTGINLNNVINNNLGNIMTSVKEENENKETDKDSLEKKKNLKNNSNLNKNKLRLENLSPENKYKKNKNYIFKKEDFERRTENVNNIKEFYYKSSKNNFNTNKFKNSAINSQKPQNQRKNINLNYYSEQNSNNEPKKLVQDKLRYFNKNNNKFNNIISNEIKEINNSNNINKEENKISNNSSNNKLKNIQEETNENREVINESKDLIKHKNSYNKNKEKIKIESMKNVIVSPETIDDLIKQSLIPFFTDNEYKYIRPIGEGSYGLIYLVENIQNKKQYALKKIICKDLYEIYKHKTQLELIYSMNHSNILELYNIQYKYLDSTTYAIYVLMERAQNDWSVDIRKRIINKNPYTEEEIINILKQVVSGLSYLQQKKITHRDVKPQNILLFKNNIFKVADLGEAKSAENKNQQMTLRGSELYMSPLLYEKYKNNKKEVFHNPYKSDVFSLGFSCLYAMNLNFNVIENIREFKNMKIIMHSINKDLKQYKYSDKLMQIIFKMIDTDENKRYDFVELEKELNNNF